MFCKGNNIMERKVAIYCRVSTQQQTTDRQKEELLKYATDNLWSIKEEHIYVDVISGFKKGEVRPCYCRMIEQVELGNINTILFSEFSRLARNATDLLNQVTLFKDYGVEMFFQKQNMWLKHDGSDLGSTILLHVLAVMSSYEIELFSERSLSGKITKVQNGHGGGDERAFGYMNDSSKKIVVNPDESDIVKRAFEMYAEGYSSIAICEVFNSENIPSFYANRLNSFIKTRKEKGLDAKQYKFDVNNLKWRPSSLNRLFHNELYVGRRKVVYYKPDPTNPIPINKRTDRKIVYEYSEHVEALRIVSDELFQRVQNRLAMAHYNKNNAVKHDNLLKYLMKCGECGSNFSVGKCSDTAKNYVSGERTYKCYGRVNRKDKPQTCKNGAELRQWKMDGLVLQLSLQMFAQIDIESSNRKRIEKLKTEISEKECIVQSKRAIIEDKEGEYRKTLKRLSRIDDEIADELIFTAKTEYDEVKRKLNDEITNLSHEIISNKVIINNLEKLNANPLLKDKMNEIREDRLLVKTMIDEYIESVFVYRIHKFWLLVKVCYKGGEEMWGTIKSARYKKEEMFFDPSLCKYGVEFQAWLLNNTEKCFSYDKETRTISYNGNSEIYLEFQQGTYDYTTFDDMVKRTEWIGSYPFFDFEKEGEKRSLSKNMNMASVSEKINWQEHNDLLLERLARGKR